MKWFLFFSCTFLVFASPVHSQQFIEEFEEQLGSTVTEAQKQSLLELFEDGEIDAQEGKVLLAAFLLANFAESKGVPVGVLGVAPEDAEDGSPNMHLLELPEPFDPQAEPEEGTWARISEPEKLKEMTEQKLMEFAKKNFTKKSFLGSRPMLEIAKTDLKKKMIPSLEKLFDLLAHRDALVAFTFHKDEPPEDVKLPYESLLISFASKTKSQVQLWVKKDFNVALVIAVPSVKLEIYNNRELVAMVEEADYRYGNAITVAMPGEIEVDIWDSDDPLGSISKGEVSRIKYPGTKKYWEHHGEVVEVQFEGLKFVHYLEDFTAGNGDVIHPAGTLRFAREIGGELLTVFEGPVGDPTLLSEIPSSFMSGSITSTDDLVDTMKKTINTALQNNPANPQALTNILQALDIVDLDHPEVKRLKSLEEEDEFNFDFWSTHIWQGQEEPDWHDLTPQVTEIVYAANFQPTSAEEREWHDNLKETVVAEKKYDILYYFIYNEFEKRGIAHTKDVRTAADRVYNGEVDSVWEVIYSESSDAFNEAAATVGVSLTYDQFNDVVYNGASLSDTIAAAAAETIETAYENWGQPVDEQQREDMVAAVTEEGEALPDLLKNIAMFQFLDQELQHLGIYLSPQDLEYYYDSYLKDPYYNVSSTLELVVYDGIYRMLPESGNYQIDVDKVVQKALQIGLQSALVELLREELERKKISLDLISLQGYAQDLIYGLNLESVQWSIAYQAVFQEFSSLGLITGSHYYSNGFIVEPALYADYLTDSWSTYTLPYVVEMAIQDSLWMLDSYYYAEESYPGISDDQYYVRMALQYNIWDHVNLIGAYSVVSYDEVQLLIERTAAGELDIWGAKGLIAARVLPDSSSSSSSSYYDSSSNYSTSSSYSDFNSQNASSSSGAYANSTSSWSGSSSSSSYYDSYSSSSSYYDYRSSSSYPIDPSSSSSSSYYDSSSSYYSSSSSYYDSSSNYSTSSSYYDSTSSSYY